TIDGSIDQTNLTFAHNIEAMRERDHNNDNDNDVSCGGCCSWFNPGGFPEDREAFGGMDRKGYSAVTVVEVSVSAVPATSSVYEVLGNNEKLKRLDAFPALAMVVVAVFCACLLVFWRPIEARTERAKEERRRLAVVAGGGTLDGATYVEWTLWAGGERCASERVFLRVDIHAEDWATVDVETSQCAAEAAAGQVLRLRVTTDASDGLPLLIQATQMGAVGRQRRVLGGLLLGLSFVAFHVEWMHRVYTSFVVALCAIGLLSLCSSAPTLTAVVSMVDASTVALTFAMSVNTHLLMLTGFFEWASGYAIRMSGGSVAKIFFLLTNLAGVLSLLLDNVTCVLLLGPISIKLCEQLGVNPLPLYLTQTLAATIGGTATLLGDPLNVLIGNKLDLSFDSFCVYNGPLMLVAMPVATAVQTCRA
ncbi:citrate transporter-domain-containing protein, partial [Pavlovales sp. CCMP2436]